MPAEQNLFWQTRSEARSKENHLTYFIAAALNTSARFRTAYGELVLAPYFNLKGWPTPTILRARAQVADYPGFGTPDLLLEMDGDPPVICEHKLTAEETIVRIGDRLESAIDETTDDHTEIRQLAKYLRISGVRGVAYFAESWRRVDVLDDPRFIRPITRGGIQGAHFTWRDLYEPLRLAADDGPVVQWLFRGFERLGYLPPPPDVGQLEPKNEPPPEVLQSLKRFVPYWNETRARLKKMGWDPIWPGSTIQLYLERNPSSLARQVIIDPSIRGRFRIRFAPTAGSEAVLEAQLREALPALDPEPAFETVKADRVAEPKIVFDLATALSTIWRGVDDPGERELRLADWVAQAAEASLRRA